MISALCDLFSDIDIDCDGVCVSAREYIMHYCTLLFLTLFFSGVLTWDEFYAFLHESGMRRKVGVILVEHMASTRKAVMLCCC